MLYDKHSTEWIDVRLIQLSVLLIMVSGFFLFRNSHQNQLVDGLSTIGELYAEGKISRRHSKSLSWQKIQGESKVFDRDMVFTPKDTHAVVTLPDGSTLVLEPESLVEFGARIQERFPIVIFSGKAKLIDPISKKEEILTPPVSTSQLMLAPVKEEPVIPIFIEPDLLKGSQLSLLNQIEAIEAQPLPIVPEIDLLPAQLEMDSLLDYQLTLDTPRPGNQRNNREFWLSLKWSPVPLEGVKYVLELSRTPDFSGSMTYQTIQSEIELHLYDSGKYFWRVTSLRGKEELRSLTQSFIVNNAARKITAEAGS